MAKYEPLATDFDYGVALDHEGNLTISNNTLEETVHVESKFIDTLVRTILIAQAQFETSN